MFCEKCGAQLPDDAKFCEKCGSSTEPGAAPAPAAAAMAAAAPAAPSAFSLALKKFFSNKRNVIIATVALLLVIAVIVAIIIIASQPKKIYIDDYFHVVFEGVDGSGYAHVEHSEKELVKLAKLNKKLFGDDYLEEGESLSKYLTISLDMTEEELNTLKNGQTIKIKLKINKDIYDEVDGYKFVLRHKTVKVKGLYKSTQLNVLDYITPVFDGYDGFGEPRSSEPVVFKLINGVEARVSSNYNNMMIEFYDTDGGYYISSVYAYFDTYDNLSNDDKITATLNASDYNTQELYSKYGIILASQTKEYTVAGLDEPDRVDVPKYITCTFDGVSTVATMDFTVSSEEITIGSYKITFTKRSSSYSREFYVDILNENGSSMRTVTYTANKYNKLKNGDKITFTAYADFKSIVSQYGIALPESFDVEVSGLTEPFNADPISRGTYSFTGYQGYGSFIYDLPGENRIYTTDDGKYTIKLSFEKTYYYKITVVVADENGRNFISFYYDCYPSSTLKNGNTVEFYCSEWESNLESYVRDYGLYFPYKVTYTVEGLKETTTVNPLESNLTFSFAKDGDYVKMTLGLKEETVAFGENTLHYSLETYSSWSYKYTKVKITVKDKDGKQVGDGYYEFQSDHLNEGYKLYPNNYMDNTPIVIATGLVFNVGDYFVIVSSQ